MKKRCDLAVITTAKEDKVYYNFYLVLGPERLLRVSPYSFIKDGKRLTNKVEFARLMRNAVEIKDYNALIDYSITDM